MFITYVEVDHMKNWGKAFEAKLEIQCYNVLV